MNARVQRAGAAWLLTLVTENRHAILTRPPTLAVLREVLGDGSRRHRFDIRALVILPDHLHAMAVLPAGVGDPTAIVREIKAATARAVRAQVPDAPSPFWRAGHWAEPAALRASFDEQVDELHHDPVHHGLAETPCAWPWSTYHRWEQARLAAPAPAAPATRDPSVPAFIAARALRQQVPPVWR